MITIKISDLFKQKEMTIKEQKEREFKVKMKKLRKKAFLDPMNLNKYMEQGYKLMDEMIKDGFMTEEDKLATINQINKDIEKAQKIIRGFRR